jgi:malate dehydrogenase (oxaloacetate-decarboxylating)
MAYTAPVTGFTERIDPTTGEVFWAVEKRGEALIDDPFLNKGTCFTAPERAGLALEGLLPPGVATESEQRARAYENYSRAGDEVGRYLFLAALQDRNETLFYRLLLDHIEEMVPIVYTPTVGKVCEQFSHIYRRPRGVYVSTRHRGRIREVLRQASSADVRVIVVTDNEAILGLGDLGVGGMPIAIGKLALYTAGAGIHPSECLPIDLDVGTENQALLDDPLYLGVRHRRLRGEAYASLLDEMVDAIREVWPNALVQWEDFANRNAFFVLDRYRRRILSFDDDIQGTGAVIVAGIRTALRKVDRRLADERVVFLGAGASGAGCALAVRAAMREAGIPDAELGRRVLCIDSRGLILADRPGLEGEKKEIAADPAVIHGWVLAREGVAGLEEVARNFAPTVLVGASGQPGAFTEAVIRAMHARCARPIVLPISNPTSKAEATPEDLLRWTGGAAVVGTGSPFAPVSIGGVTHQIGQGNNAFIFPGVGLGATAVSARWLPDAAFTAAGRALDEATGGAGAPGSPIYPPLRRLRETSVAVARAVARALVSEGAADPVSGEEIDARILDRMWEPRYRPYRAATHPEAVHG